MSFSLIPDLLLTDYGDLTPQMLTERGICLLLCDLDYTLAPKYVPRPDDRLRAWLAEMQRAGIRVMILSNNRSPARVERFCRDLGIDYVGHAGKPSPRGYRQAMEKAGVGVADIDLVEANEAFAAQSVAVARELGFDMSKVNVNGGAISIGHPVGASGARIIVTLLHEMQKRPEAKRGLATLCIGGGMGVATIFEKC